MKKSVYFILLLFCFVNKLFSLDLYPEQNKGKAGLPGEYLSNFSPSISAMGRGKTGTTLIDDPASPYFNPAALGTNVTRKLSFLNSKIFYGTSYSFIGYAHPVSSKSVFGISTVMMSVDGAQETLESGAATGRTFGETDRCYIISYAKRWGKRTIWGVNLKLVSQEMLDSSDAGYGFDIGFLWQSPFLGSIWGFCLQNLFQPKIKLGEKADTFPMNLRMGYSLKIFENLGIFQDFLFENLLPDKDLFSGSARMSTYINTGIECRLKKNFFIRAGQDNKDISLGIGFITRFVDFDYALNSHYLGLRHYFSLAFKFGVIPTEQERQLREREIEVRIKEAYNNALAFFNESRYERAKDCIRECLLIDSENKKAKKLLQKIELKERKFRARKLYEEAFADFDAGRDKEAFNKIKEANELDPDIAKILEKEYLEKADESFRAKQYKESRQNLIRVLQINKENKKANQMLKKLETILEIMEGK
ncbi:MAG: PorV/PorQ family protein [Elusimicrobia bacterium]|nr:PorV/PorQ family protein [Elusimicrobiota bacterium]